MDLVADVKPLEKGSAPHFCDTLRPTYFTEDLPMKITIVTVGKLKEKYLKQGIEEYVKRLGPYANNLI